MISRFDGHVFFNGHEASSWFIGVGYTLLGLFFCARSCWLTRIVFALDGEIGSRPQSIEYEQKDALTKQAL